jgi:hypothetical protein
MAAMPSAATDPAPVSSPCTGVCRLGGDGLCEGCRRSGEEIALWRALDEAERLRWMREVLPARRRPA